ncbi:chemotaxis protein CheX [Psychrobacter sp. I-STPA6b]|uniref:chemotaxis protein CheX n=1 Tax=Psychrobacter sp. I-STPA6b TaxID=2585718 RepID=UPI001D0C29D4|nr:chemotaxis protein CheX [Psychrobacter sp. I-STPA6b]
MKEKRLQIFVDIIKNYFGQFGQEEVEVDTPYLLENKQPTVLDYTGVIGISGIKKGVVCFTATEQLLERIMREMGEPDQSDENFVDLVGEVANTIAGNARTEFGAEFHISVPIVFRGLPQSMILPKKERSFIIPIYWYEQTAEIIIYLQD